MAKTSSKPAGKQAIKAGPSGKMHKFGGAGAQQPGISSVTPHSGKGAAFPSGGPSGKMNKGGAVKAQKSGRSGQA